MTNRVAFAFMLFNLCCIGNICLCQPYETVFGKDTTQWNVIYMIPDNVETYIYKAFGDTSINEVDYKPLYEGSPGRLGDKYGYLREDTATGKLWFLSDYIQEELIMDLSLEKSDTFIFEPSIKYTVDTVFYRSGRKYISFNENSLDSVLFIEGIGPYNFLYSDHVLLPYYAQIRCMFKDNTLVFKNNLYSDCYDTGTGIVDNQAQSINIYPNPASNYFAIGSDDNKTYSVEIYNAIGYLMLKEAISMNRQIYIGNLPPGLYVVRINDELKPYLFKLNKL
jgi:hypothetical protein